MSVECSPPPASSAPLNDWAGGRLFAVLVEIAAGCVPPGAGSGSIVPTLAAYPANVPERTIAAMPLLLAESYPELMNEEY